MKQAEIIKMLEILVDEFRSIQEEVFSTDECYSEEDLRSKAKFVLLRMILED